MALSQDSLGLGFPGLLNAAAQSGSLGAGSLGAAQAPILPPSLPTPAKKASKPSKAKSLKPFVAKSKNSVMPTPSGPKGPAK